MLGKTRKLYRCVNTLNAKVPLDLFFVVVYLAAILADIDVLMIALVQTRCSAKINPRNL